MKHMSICGECEEPIVFNAERQQWLFAGKHEPWMPPAHYCGKSRNGRHVKSEEKERLARRE